MFTARRFAVLVFFTMSTIAVVDDLCAQDANEQLARIRSDWKKRRDAVKTIRYYVEGERTLYREGMSSLTGQRVERDHRTPTKHLFLLDFANSRHRIDSEDYNFNLNTEKSTKSVRKWGFDGKYLMGLHDRGADKVPKATSAKDADGGIAQGVNQKAPIPGEYWPILFAHGIVGIEREDAIIPGKLAFEPKLELLLFHGRGVQNGRPCLVFRTPFRKGRATFFEEFWVDSERDSALVRRRWFTDSTATDDLEIDYHKTSHGWLLKSWTETSRVEKSDGKSVTTSIWRCQVKDVGINPAITDADFRVDFAPGMLIRKVSAGDGGSNRDERLFRIASDGDWHEVVFENGVERKVGLRMWRWLWLLLILPLAALLHWGHRQRARPKPSFLERKGS